MKMAPRPSIRNHMTKKLSFSLFLLLLLSACVKFPGQAAATDTPVIFVISTLPPKATGYQAPSWPAMIDEMANNSSLYEPDPDANSNKPVVTAPEFE
jgi:hypothetical protein